MRLVATSSTEIPRIAQWAFQAIRSTSNSARCPSDGFVHIRLLSETLSPGCLRLPTEGGITGDSDSILLASTPYITLQSALPSSCRRRGTSYHTSHTHDAIFAGGVIHFGRKLSVQTSFRAILETKYRMPTWVLCDVHNTHGFLGHDVLFVSKRMGGAVGGDPNVLVQVAWRVGVLDSTVGATVVVL